MDDGEPSYHGIVRRERLHGSDARGFFADIQVQKAVNFSQAVHLGGLLFEPADAHFAKQEKRMFLVDLRGLRNHGGGHLESLQR
jgi:hypothetical protein